MRSTNVWDRVGDGRYVSDGYVKRNTALHLATCPPAPPAPVAAPPPGASGSWVVPVPGAVGQAFRPAGNPTHDGVDIMEPRFTAIVAASAGVVITVTCNTSGTTCDVDGGPTVRGCGWYVEVLHPGQVVTRYCHLVRRPDVVEGQQVATGQVLGYVGTSGNSSGPHLHFEVHVRREALNNRKEVYEPVDPVPFLAQRGVKLGAA